MKTDERNKRFCRNVLVALRLALGNAPRKGLSGDSLLDQANAPLAFDQKLEDEREVMQILSELELSGYITAEVIEPRRRGQTLKLSHQLFKIIAKGVQLLNEQIPADPSIWDERVEY